MINNAFMLKIRINKQFKGILSNLIILFKMIDDIFKTINNL